MNLSYFRDTAHIKAAFTPNPISQIQIKFHCSENAAHIHVQWGPCIFAAVFLRIQHPLPKKIIKLQHQQRLKPTQLLAAAASQSNSQSCLLQSEHSKLRTGHHKMVIMLFKQSSPAQHCWVLSQSQIYCECNLIDIENTDSWKQIMNKSVLCVADLDLM